MSYDETRLVTDENGKLDYLVRFLKAERKLREYLETGLDPDHQEARAYSHIQRMIAKICKDIADGGG